MYKRVKVVHSRNVMTVRRKEKDGLRDLYVLPLCGSFFSLSRLSNGSVWYGLCFAFIVYHRDCGVDKIDWTIPAISNYLRLGVRDRIPMTRRHVLLNHEPDHFAGHKKSITIDRHKYYIQI